MKTELQVLCLFASLALMTPTGTAETNLGEFRVWLENGERLEGDRGILTEQGLEGRLRGGRPVSIPHRDIRALDRSVGSRAGRGAKIGGAIGLCAGAIAMMLEESRTSTEPYHRVDQRKMVTLILGYTAGGALIGWAYGNSKRIWKKVPLDGSFDFSGKEPEIRLALHLSF